MSQGLQLLRNCWGHLRHGNGCGKNGMHGAVIITQIMVEIKVVALLQTR